MANSDWVKLTSYSVPYMAELLLSALEANGIATRVFNGHASSIIQMIPTDVMVQEKDLVEAKKLLIELETLPSENSETEK